MKSFISTVVDFIKKYYYLGFCAIALLLPDIALRIFLQPWVFDEGYVEIVSKAFTVSWILLIVFFCAVVLPKKAGRITFIIISALFIVLSFAQYIYYKIFDQFFWLKSIILAGEGANYLDYAIKQIDIKILLCIFISAVSVVIAAIKWNHPVFTGKKRVLQILSCLIPILSITFCHIYMMPETHNETVEEWDIWCKPRAVYKNFNDVNKSFEATGLYQFTYLNLYTAIFPNDNYDENDFARADEYFALKGAPSVNEYSGLFEGKNIIAVMMESMDTWVIDREHTPTLYSMMKNGINFTNYNAPFFGTGFTFSSEFAFNTGFFTPVSAISASVFSKNSFPYSLARLFGQAGYTTNSFHFNNSEFYNRGIMHKCFGYEKYNSIYDYGTSGTAAELDSNMVKNDAIYDKMTANTPFFDFIITYSAHLPYAGESPKLLLAREYRPDLIDTTEHEEKNNIQILAADTDEFFRLLLERLEEDGLLDDTVIVAYTDHFAYGISDAELLNEWRGDALSYTVPAFIYAKGINPQSVTKPMMTIDWAPTLVNLFGLSSDARYIGNDILDPENNGFVYFETWGWMNEKMHYEPSEQIASDDEELIYIQKQSQRVKDSIEVNDIVVMGDYYRKR